MKRNTFQKAMILEALHTLHHPTADDIYSYILEQYPHISKGTVYRNLSQMVNEKMILQVKMPDGADHFDHTTCEHYHFHCTCCGRIFDIDVPYKNELNSIQSAKGFMTQNHSLLFSGMCADCNNKQQMEEKND